MSVRPTKRSRSSHRDSPATAPAQKRRQLTKTVDRAWLLRLLNACEQNVEIPLTYPETDNDLRIKFTLFRTTIMRCSEQDARDYEPGLMTAIRELAGKEGQTVNALISTIMPTSYTAGGSGSATVLPRNLSWQGHRIAAQPPTHSLHSISDAPVHSSDSLHDHEMCDVPLQQRPEHEYPSQMATFTVQNPLLPLHPPAQLGNGHYLHSTRWAQGDAPQPQQCGAQAFTGHPLLRSKVAMELAIQGGLV